MCPSCNSNFEVLGVNNCQPQLLIECHRDIMPNTAQVWQKPNYMYSKIGLDNICGSHKQSTGVPSRCAHNYINYVLGRVFWDSCLNYTPVLRTCNCTYFYLEAHNFTELPNVTLRKIHITANAYHLFSGIGHGTALIRQG